MSRGGANRARGTRSLSARPRPDDLAATVFHLLGIDPAAEVRDAAGRPLPIAEGEPVLDVVA